ncbi:alkaline phosphatase [uncultured Porphyromonas sp.]|uniref:alkaline phosphatase n=1 Tax=uncultured Porphyromonas sp. TaxID=159274 RepID=UPI00262FEBB2|nr:alkaline phosphatase [uncultured Porphyromonas sp.]
MIRKKLLLLALLALGCGSLWGQLPATVKPVRNIIVMIPDGTSLPALSLARWYQRYQHPDKIHLHLDSILCGTVLTYCSDAPIGDSAPTTSCYMTGIPSQSGFIATYPVSTDHDLQPLDPKLAYQPMTTLLEAGKWKLGKRTGLVVTCEFTHATPADCSAHSYNRKKYDWIAPQIVNLPVDVVIGGGNKIITPALQQSFKDQGIPYFANDLESMRAFQGKQMWALFGEYDMPYDLDRDPSKVPSLAESCQKAISLLNDPEGEGFFLMVEGSKVDWAAHANDPVGIASEMLAFDKAVGVALDFARRDGNTAIIIMPDHGNSGLSIGLQRLRQGDKQGPEVLFGQLTAIKRTAAGLAKMLNEAPNDQARELFHKYAAIDLSEEELDALYQCEEYKNSPIPLEQRKGSSAQTGLYNGSLSAVVILIYQQHMPFGFTTHSHTGEEVFMAAYHPQGTRPMGMILNTEVNEYLCRLWGLEGQLPLITQEAYVPHKQLFEGQNCRIVGAEGQIPDYLEVSLAKSKKLRIYPFSPKMAIGTDKDFKRGKEKLLKAPNNAVWVDKTQTFYLNKTVLDLIR